MMTTENSNDRLHIKQVPLWLHGAVWGVFAALTLILGVLFFTYREVPVWEGLRAAGELKKPGYTEAIYADSIFRTRANTWSNLAYVLVGLYGIALALWDRTRAYGDRDPYVTRQPWLPILFGIACCYLGIGSGIFHASLSRWGQQLDVAAMYSPLVVLIAIHWARWIPRANLGGRSLPTWPAFAAVTVVASVLLYIYKWELSSKQVMLTLILLISAGGFLDAITRRFSLQQRWLGLAFVSLIAAYFFRQIDLAGRFTGPDAWLQGHAIWHVLTGLTLGLMILFYRSEVVTTAEQRNPAHQPTASRQAT
jgi:hypothetical protein